jgi:hypothetical protein
MTPFDDPSDGLLTSWTLGRDGQKLTCTLITERSGVYVLRLSHDGLRVIDERCDSPSQALNRSLEAFRLFVARGWVHESSIN